MIRRAYRTSLISASAKTPEDRLEQGQFAPNATMRSRIASLRGRRRTTALPQMLVFGAGSAAIGLAGVALAGGGTGALVAAPLAGVFLTAVLTYDYTGSTPVEGGSHFEERRWHVTLDLDRCRGVFSCWEVCPEACFEKRDDVRKVDLAHDERCIRCGACVVQCPMDALAFEDADGARVEPDGVRRFKQNLNGKRAIDRGATPPVREDRADGRP
jgi:NAD-dependent dihydropyrimidine dehydrogenase PreA subunit